MSWSCSVCQEKFSRKDSMRRHMSHKHSESRSFTPFKAVPFSPEKCQRFHFVHPFTCMVAGMTGSGKTVWVQSLLQQAQNVIEPPPERIIWCYSQWQPAYSELLNTARQYMQLQNRFLAFKQQLNSRSRESNPLYSEEQRENSSNLLPGHVPRLFKNKLLSKHQRLYR